MERLNNNTNMESQNSEASMDLIVSRAMAAVKEDQKQDIVHEKPTLKHSVIKTAGAMATAAAIGLGMTGCAEIQETPTTITEVQPSETKPSVTTSESGTSVEVDPVVVTQTTETTTAPTETTVKTTAPTETEVNAELAAAPEISGLSKEIENGKVVYKAVEGNEYGIEAGEFAGEYNANVSVEGSRVGGVILEPEVITKIMGDKSEIIPPLDITKVNKDTGLNIVDTTDSFYTEYLGKEYQTMVIEFNGQLELINPFVEDNQFNTIDEISANLTYKTDSGNIIDFKNQVGLTPFLALAAQDEGRTEMGMEDYFYVFNVENTDKMNNLDEGIVYKKGEKTGILVDSYLAVYNDYFNFGETTTDNLARTEDGAVIFAYPQETTIVETNN